PRFAEHAGGARVFLKREDLNHTGSHKINNVLVTATSAVTPANASCHSTNACARPPACAKQ
ncbi:hypothetical protein ACWC2K_29115, partial [Streptomyces chattanoogensis]